jgi:exonuclease VII small subunit
MENIIKKISKSIDTIENADNYDTKLKLYKNVKVKVNECEKKILYMKNTVENPNDYINDNVKNYTNSDESESSIVPLDYAEMKTLFDKSEIFDCYVKRLHEIEESYENAQLSVENKLTLYVESHTLIRWCKSYLNKKEANIEII